MRLPISPCLASARTYPSSNVIVAPSFSITIICRSTGRVPIAHPPGSDTLAAPIRASNGPSTKMDARILRTISYDASIPIWPFICICKASSCIVLSTFRLASNSRMDCVSARSGQPSSINLSSVSKARHINGKAAFLAPLIGITPLSWPPPTMFNLSMIWLSFAGRR